MRDTVVDEVSNKERLLWADIDAYGRILAQHTIQADTLVKNYLGYLPEPFSYYPHIVFIRALIENRNKGLITEAEYAEQIYKHMINIRNDDMKKAGWMENLPYDDFHLEAYNLCFAPYKDLARNRIKEFLGFEPKFEHSIHAELLVRELYSFDNFVDGMNWTSWDYLAMTILTYTKALLESGEPAADSTPLLGPGENIRK